MRRLFLLSSALAAAVVPGGCVQTSVSSLKASDVSPVGYHRILVFYPISNLAERTLVESQFAENSDSSATFVASAALFFPGRQYSRAELRRIVAENHIDAMLMLGVTDAGVDRGRLPVVANASCQDQLLSVSCTAYQTRGGDITKPWAVFTAQLVDLASEKVVWTAALRSNGSAFNKADDLLRSMAKTTMKKLHEDGVAH